MPQLNELVAIAGSLIKTVIVTQLWMLRPAASQSAAHESRCRLRLSLEIAGKGSTKSLTGKRRSTNRTVLSLTLTGNGRFQRDPTARDPAKESVDSFRRCR